MLDDRASPLRESNHRGDVGSTEGVSETASESAETPRASAAAFPPLMRFLIPAMRLVDLHDSRRTPGADMAPLTEERTGPQDGVYCAIASAVLEYLRDCETHGAIEFVDLVPFSKEHCGDFGAVPEDVLWVAQTLATPTEARWPGGSTKATAPLKKLRRGHSYMLDRVGRELLAYVAGYFRWVHAGAEARKLIADLENGDFDSFRDIAQRILTKIRSELFDLRQMKEQPELNVLQQSFVSHSSRFIKTFIEVSRVISEAQAQLRNPTTVRMLQGWAEANETEVEDVLGEANDSLTRVASANAMLHRLVADFVAEVQSRQRSLVGVITFDKAIDRFLRFPSSSAETNPAFLEAVMGKTGPVSFPGLEFNPLEVRHSVPKRTQAEPKARQRIRREKLDPKLDRIDAFVARNREVILRMLETGPISLSEFLVADEIEDPEQAINNYDLDLLVEMATVFFSPYVLRLDDQMKSKCLRFRLGEETTWTLKDGWTLRGPELIMELVERKI